MSVSYFAVFFCTGTTSWKYALKFVYTAALGHGDVIRVKRAHRGAVGLTLGNYSGMVALLRAHVMEIYILSQLVKNLGESVRGGEDRKHYPLKKGALLLCILKA